MLKRYVLTGAPGAGKTTVGRALCQRGWSFVPEAATDVIAAEQARGIDEPWQSDEFVDKVVTLQMQRQNHSPADDVLVQVYDRSPLCTLALARYLQRPVTRLLALEVARVTQEQVYQRDVFLVRALGFIVPSAARRISYQGSLDFEAVHEAVYLEHGFHLVDVRPDEVHARVAAIETQLSAHRARSAAETGCC